MMRYFTVMKRIFTAALLLVMVMVSLFAAEIVIRNVEVSPSAILSDEEIDAIVSECLGKYTGIDILIGIVDRINTLYRAKGFPNAMAFIPEQTVQDGTAVVELIEGRLGALTVTGNRLVRGSYILNSLDLDKGSVLSLTELEEKLLAFNRWNSGIRLSSTLNPGRDESGTTDVEINVSESFPVTAYATIDNFASEATGAFRGGLHLVVNDVSGNGDSLLAGGYLNWYSRSAYLDYSIPVFDEEDMQQIRFGFRGSFGGSEASNGSASEFGIKSTTFNASLYMSMLLARTQYRNTTLAFSGIVASTTTAALDTLLTKETVVSGRMGIASSEIISDRFTLSYGAGITVGTPYKGARDLDEIYLKLDASLQARLELFSAMYMVFNASGQTMPLNNIIPNQEQMYVGGGNTVRGYSEGCAWGKDVYTASLELHCLLPFSHKSTIFGFVDHAGVFPYTGDGEHFLLGVGGGLDIYIGERFHFKASVATALIEISQNNNPDGFRFTIAATFTAPGF